MMKLNKLEIKYMKYSNKMRKHEKNRIQKCVYSITQLRVKSSVSRKTLGFLAGGYLGGAVS